MSENKNLQKYLIKSFMIDTNTFYVEEFPDDSCYGYTYALKQTLDLILSEDISIYRPDANVKCNLTIERDPEKDITKFKLEKTPNEYYEYHIVKY